MILPEHEANRLLTDAGVPMIAMKVVTSAQEAKAGAGDLRYPVVLKLSSSLYPHKTEIGGVFLNLENEDEVEGAFGKLEQLRDKLDRHACIILERMAPAGAEFFVGFQSHPQFGPVISLGLGGVLLELIQDVTFRLIPAGTEDFREMFAELQSWPKLKKGFRNLPPVNEGRLLNVLEKMSEVVLLHREIAELDLNPVVVTSKGPIVVDARIVTHVSQPACQS
jgi:succinyl-CoA synthetase beta subunit